MRHFADTLDLPGSEYLPPPSQNAFSQRPSSKWGNRESNNQPSEFGSGDEPPRSRAEDSSGWRMDRSEPAAPPRRQPGV